MPETQELFRILVQLPIVGVIVWVILKLMEHAKDERGIFMNAMKEQSQLFSNELRAERESREATTMRTMTSLTELAVAISELRGEVRTTTARNGPKAESR